MSLAVVSSYQTDEPVVEPDRMFEGEKVEGLRAKLISGAALELSEDHHRIDQTARLLVTGRVTRVDHIVEERSGKLVRVETFKIVDAVEVPWDVVAQLLDQ